MFCVDSNGMTVTVCHKMAKILTVCREPPSKLARTPNNDL